MLFSSFNFLDFVFRLISLLISLAVHEFSHSFVADKLGDPTSRLDGRLTLNPMKHIDFNGLLFILLTPFGWAKPVQVDPYNFRHPRKDTAKVSIAGPIANILLAILASIVLRSFNLVVNGNPGIIGYFFTQLIIVNIGLALFNCIPIFPLDGFSVVEGLLPRDQAADWAQLRRYGLIFLLVLIIPINGNSMLSMIIGPVFNGILPLFIPSFGGGGIV